METTEVDVETPANPRGRMRKAAPVYVEIDSESDLDIAEGDEVTAVKQVPPKRGRKRKDASDNDEEFVPSPKKLKPMPKPKAEPKPKKAPKPKAEPKPKKVPKPRAAPKPKGPPKTGVKRVRKQPAKKLTVPSASNSNSDGVQDDQELALPDEKDIDISTVLFQWEIEAALGELLDLPPWVVKNTCRLFAEGNTIPFIARYRQEMTNGMDAGHLREFQDVLEMLQAVQVKAARIINTLEKAGKLTPLLQSAFLNARTLTELEHLYAPFKAGNKKTLADRARNLGLERPAFAVIGDRPYNLQEYVQAGQKGLATVAEVETGVQHIIADIISKEPELLDGLRMSLRNAHVLLESSKSKAAEKKEKTEQKGTKNFSHGHTQKDDPQKFELYFQFSIPVKYVKPHQVLALNRGESLKILSLKVAIPERLKHELKDVCARRWNCRTFGPYINQHRVSLIMTSVEDAYTRLIEPLFCRQIRSDLTKTAEKSSVEVFMLNLRQLLLTPPIRGKVILGIDPGFKHGCKLAMINPTGAILETGVFHLPFNNSHNEFAAKNKQQLRDLMLRYRCETIGIGNGTACRETEAYMSEMIGHGEFRPLNVMYCMVNESGASIYSVTEEAAAEMPDFHPNLRSAVSIARRLQDPMAEYVKIEPKHLGVGMYQHDVAEAMLQKGLDSIVVECVSFVGVDLNTSSEVLLRKVAGLNATKAKNIVQWRMDNGRFINREQLRLVKGVGAKSVEQCAGFVRIMTDTLSNFAAKPEDTLPTSADDSSVEKPAKKRKSAEVKPNFLDMTSIHPESYGVANKFLAKLGKEANDIIKPEFAGQVRQFLQSNPKEKIIAEFVTGSQTMDLIINGFLQPFNYDIRSEFEKPLFRKGIISLEELKPSTVVTGKITNIVHFGAFVDIGVGTNGLLHNSRSRGTTLNLGDRLEVTILDVDVRRKRIGLALNKVL